MEILCPRCSAKVVVRSKILDAEYRVMCSECGKRIPLKNQSRLEPDKKGAAVASLIRRKADQQAEPEYDQTQLLREDSQATASQAGPEQQRSKPRPETKPSRKPKSAAAEANKQSSVRAAKPDRPDAERVSEPASKRTKRSTAPAGDAVSSPQPKEAQAFDSDDSAVLIRPEDVVGEEGSPQPAIAIREESEVEVSDSESWYEVDLEAIEERQDQTGEFDWNDIDEDDFQDSEDDIAETKVSAYELPKLPRKNKKGRNASSRRPKPLGEAEKQKDDSGYVSVYSAHSSLEDRVRARSEESQKDEADSELYKSLIPPLVALMLGVVAQLTLPASGGDVWLPGRYMVFYQSFGRMGIVCLCLFASFCWGAPPILRHFGYLDRFLELPNKRKAMWIGGGCLAFFVGLGIVVVSAVRNQDRAIRTADQEAGGGAESQAPAETKVTTSGDYAVVTSIRVPPPPPPRSVLRTFQVMNPENLAPEEPRPAQILPAERLLQTGEPATLLDGRLAQRVSTKPGKWTLPALPPTSMRPEASEWQTDGERLLAASDDEVIVVSKANPDFILKRIDRQTGDTVDTQRLSYEMLDRNRGNASVRFEPRAALTANGELLAIEDWRVGGASLDIVSRDGQKVGRIQIGDNSRLEVVWLGGRIAVSDSFERNSFRLVVSRLQAGVCG